MTSDGAATPGDGSLCPIVFAIDDAYGMPLATTIRSVAEACPGAWPIEFFVLAHAVSEETRNRVAGSLPEAAGTIHWVPVELSDFGDFSTLPHIATVTFARLRLTELLPRTLSRVLYLDSDLLVLDDLASLCRTDLGDAVLGAVADAYLEVDAKRFEPELADLPRVKRYFNAGVLLIDLERWRELDPAAKAMAYLERRPGSRYADQDALNVACDGRWAPLDARWNVQDHDWTLGSDACIGDAPRILHFTTSRKPWMAGRLSRHKDLYDAYRSRTRFARTSSERVRDGCLASWARAIGLLRRLRPGGNSR